MTREEKILEAVKKANEIKQKYNFIEEELEVEFIIEGKPVPYARARHTRFGGKNGKGRFYNPKEKEMNQYNKEFMKQIPENVSQRIKELDEKSIYYVELYCDFYVPIQKADSIERSALKEAGIIKPTLRNGDSDNYVKFVQDALHNVLYDDDKVVTVIRSNKLYSLKPRTEIKAKIKIIKK